MLSLYDYLGYPAGEKLGKLVSDYAKIRKYNGTVYRMVQTKNYQGYVTTYSKEFLDEFFDFVKLYDKYVAESLEEMTQLLEEMNTTLNED